MDGKGTYRIICRNPPSVDVDYNPERYARLPHPDITVEREAESRWIGKVAANPALFNASKYRFHALQVSDNQEVTLQLGLTDYKSFVCTHSCERPLVQVGAQHMARPIGNAVVCVSADGLVPMLRRSHTVGEGVGHIGFPGGHPEPSMASGTDRRAVAHELRSAAWREVSEELFLDEHEMPPLEQLRCIGFVARAKDEKVCQIFTLTLGAAVNKHVLAKLYAERRGDGEESDKLVFCTRHQLERALQVAAVGDAPIMPDHLGALDLWLHADCEQAEA